MDGYKGNIYIDTPINTVTGIGIFGYQLMKYAMLQGHKVICLGEIKENDRLFSPLDLYIVEQCRKHSEEFIALFGEAIKFNTQRPFGAWRTDT